MDATAFWYVQHDTVLCVFGSCTLSAENVDEKAVQGAMALDLTRSRTKSAFIYLCAVLIVRVCVYSKAGSYTGERREEERYIKETAEPVRRAKPRLLTIGH